MLVLSDHNYLVIFMVSFYPKLKIPQVIYCQISSS